MQRITIDFLTEWKEERLQKLWDKRLETAEKIASAKCDFIAKDIKVDIERTSPDPDTQIFDDSVSAYQLYIRLCVAQNEINKQIDTLIRIKTEYDLLNAYLEYGDD